MTAPIADRLSRQALTERIGAELAAEQANVQRDKSWFNRGMVQGLGKALHLIESAVAETGPDYSDGYAAGLIDGKLIALQVIEETMPEEHRHPRTLTGFKETD